MDSQPKKENNREGDDSNVKIEGLILHSLVFVHDVFFPLFLMDPFS